MFLMLHRGGNLACIGHLILQPYFANSYASAFHGGILSLLPPPTPTSLCELISKVLHPSMACTIIKSKFCNCAVCMLRCEKLQFFCSQAFISLIVCTSFKFMDLRIWVVKKLENMEDFAVNSNSTH